MTTDRKMPTMITVPYHIIPLWTYENTNGFAGFAGGVEWKGHNGVEIADISARYRGIARRVLKFLCSLASLKVESGVFGVYNNAGPQKQTAQHSMTEKTGRLPTLHNSLLTCPYPCY